MNASRKYDSTHIGSPHFRFEGAGAVGAAYSAGRIAQLVAKLTGVRIHISSFLPTNVPILPHKRRQFPFVSVMVEGIRTVLRLPNPVQYTIRTPELLVPNAWGVLVSPFLAPPGMVSVHVQIAH